VFGWKRKISSPLLVPVLGSLAGDVADCRAGRDAGAEPLHVCAELGAVLVPSSTGDDGACAGVVLPYFQRLPETTVRSH